MRLMFWCAVICSSLLSQITLGQTASNTICPRKCVCIENNINCSHASIQSLNWTFPVNTTHINLSNNNITNFELENFENVMLTLKEFDISCNQLLDLPLTLLHRFTELQVLKASYNKIAVRFRGFGPVLTNKKLRVLDLSYNNIRVYGAPLFSGLPNLTHVYLDHNIVPIFSTIYFAFLPVIHTISLSYNNITMLGFPVAIPVKDLNLIGNNFTFNNFPSAILLPNLTTLEIGRLGLKLFPGNLNLLTSLMHLFIKNFSQNTLSSQLFSASRVLFTFEMEGGSVKEIVIQNMHYISGLNFRLLPELTTFSVSSCRWLSRFGSIRFRNVTNLTTVIINDMSELDIFDEDFFHIEGDNSVTFLNLSLNSLAIVSEESFRSFTKLEILDLSINRIAYVNPNSFVGLTRLILVNLSGNLLHNIPNDFLLSSSILNLNLSYNLIRSVSPNWHRRLDDLKNVDMSYNLIRTMVMEPKQLPQYNLLDNAWNCSCQLWKEVTAKDFKRYCQNSSLCYNCHTPKKYIGQTIYDLAYDCQKLSTNIQLTSSWVVIVLCGVVGLLLLSVLSVVLYRFKLCQCKKDQA